MSKVRRRGREIGLYLITVLGCFSLLLSVQATAYAQCATDWTCQIVDSSGDVGEYTSLVFDASGRPAISYHNYTNHDLKLAYDRNNDGVFSGANEIIAVDEGGNVGWYTSIAFDLSGYPAISYLDLSNGDMKCAYDRNGNGDFSDAGEIIPVDSDGYVGEHTSLTFDSSGYLAISYFDRTNYDLKLAYDRNNDGDFLDTNEIITVDSPGDVGRYTSLIFDASSKPVISYYDNTNHDLKLAYDRNNDGDFLDINEIITVDSSGDVGEYSSIAFDASGKLAISYYDNSNGDLKLAYDRNNDGDFLDTNEIIIVDNDGNVGVGISLAFDTSGNLAISYSDETKYDTKFAHDLDGSGDFEAEEIIVVDSDNNVGGYPSLAFDASGNPAISYYDYTNDDLKLARYSPTAAVIIKKTADPPSVIEDGENVQFTINVTNSGKVDVTIESLTDSVFDLSTRCADAAGKVLAADESYACTFTEFISGSIGDPHQNTATVNASDDGGNWDTDEDTATVSFETEVQVFGVTLEVTCDILADVEIWVGGTGPVFSAGNGSYEIYAPGSGSYDISAAKEGFRDRVMTEYIEGPDAVNLNFQADYGLIPCSPDIWYTLECVNLWLYPPSPECGLSQSAALAVINAWLYPGCP